MEFLSGSKRGLPGDLFRPAGPVRSAGHIRQACKLIRGPGFHRGRVDQIIT